MTNRSDISKENLYNSVKTLIECPQDHIHLSQQKIYTLFSIAFQYLLYTSVKKPGVFIIRTEDRFLAEKLARKSKDETTRKFMNRLIMNRKLRYEESYIYLDYFSFQSWSLTSNLPKEKIRNSLVVKNTSHGALVEENDFRNMVDAFEVQEFGKHYYIKTLQELSPKTITISYQEQYPNLTEVKFPFIPEPEEVASGVKINENIDF